MFTSSVFDPGLGPCLLAILVLGALAWGTGRLLVPAKWTADDWLAGGALHLISGLLFLSGIGGIICLHRLSYMTLIPLTQILLAVWARKNEPAAIKEPFKLTWRDALLPCLVLVGGAAFEWWQSSWVMPDGSLRILHYDYGYWAMLIKGVLEAHAADGWAATLGAHVNECVSDGDSWYHWNPLMLAGAVTAITGMMPLASLLHVVGILLDVGLMLAAGAIVRNLTGMSPGKSLLLGTLSLTCAQYPQDAGAYFLGLDRETDTLQHIRANLAYYFSYKFEGMLLLLVVLMWLRKQPVLALVLLACAAISSPHAVAIVGVAGGVLGGLGVLKRNQQMWQTGLAMCVAVGCVWAALHFVFGTGLPTLHAEGIASSPTALLGEYIQKGLREACTGLVLGLVSMPGILYLILAKDARLGTESRLLGWLALSSIVGSYIGYRLLSGIADNWHIVNMSHAVIVTPVGVWGLGCMLTSGRTLTLPIVATLLILLSLAMGISDTLSHYYEYVQTPWKRGELDPVKKALGGEPFGYFAPKDRQWWLPWHSSMAALLDVRCMRIQELPKEDVEHNPASNRPYRLVPPMAGETPDAWTLRFLPKAGIRFLMEFSNNKLPEGVKSHAHQILKVPYVTLYELNPQ